MVEKFRHDFCSQNLFKNWIEYFFYDRTINTDDLLYNHKVNVEQFIKHYSIRYRKKKIHKFNLFRKGNV